MFQHSSQIPPLEHEKPIGHFHGMLLANQAWHCRHDDLWPPKAGEKPPTEEQRNAVDLYLANFCRPVKSIANEVRCVACNQDLTLPYGQGPKTTFTQTFLKIDRQSPTREGRCGGCGYPVRTRHLIRYIGTGIAVVKLDFFPLCYHPSATDQMLLVPR